MDAAIGLTMIWSDFVIFGSGTSRRTAPGPAAPLTIARKWTSHSLCTFAAEAALDLIIVARNSGGEGATVNLQYVLAREAYPPANLPPRGALLSLSNSLLVPFSMERCSCALPGQ